MENNQKTQDSVISEDNSSNRNILIIIGVGAVIALCLCACICIFVWAGFTQSITNSLEQYSEEFEEELQKELDQIEEQSDIKIDINQDTDNNKKIPDHDFESLLTDQEVDELYFEVKALTENSSFDNVFRNLTATETTIDDDPVKGSIDEVPIVIVEFTDFECPFCEMFNSQKVPQIEQNLIAQDKVAFVVRDFPLTMHEPEATNAAKAAECVDQQLGDKAYFEMHDFIFQNGPSIIFETMKDKALEIGVQEAIYTECYNSTDAILEVEDDISDAFDAGISGTPGLVVGFVNSKGEVKGVRLEGNVPYQTIDSVVEQMLNLISPNNI